MVCDEWHDRQPRASGGHARRSLSRKLCVLHLPHERQPRARRLYTAPATRVVSWVRCEHWCSDEWDLDEWDVKSGAAVSGVWWVTRRQPRASGGHARRSLSRKLCVLRLPHERQPRASGGLVPWKAAAGQQRPGLCVLRLPHDAAPPGGSVYCASHTSGAMSEMW